MQRVIARTVPVGPEGANRDLARDFTGPCSWLVDTNGMMTSYPSCPTLPFDFS
jgi:hypothetical protein